MTTYNCRRHIVSICILLSNYTVTTHTTEASTVRRQNTFETGPHHNNTITVSPVISPTIVASLLPPWNVNDFIKEVPALIEQVSIYSISFLKKHQWKIVTAGLAGGYIGLHVYFLASNHHLNNTSLWGAWNPTWSPDTISMNQHALINEILTRYMTPKNPTDTITPLIEFLKIIDQEITFLQRYITISSIFAYGPSSFLFPCSKEKIIQAHCLLQRAMIIKKLFFNWLSDHNLHTVTA